MYKKNNKLKILIISVVTTIILAGGYIFYFISEEGEKIKYEELFNDNRVDKSKEIDEKEEEREVERIIVHIAGYVVNPGVIELKEGSRISDAIEGAGGLQDVADISKINLAYVLEDGMKIYIPSHTEIDNIEKMEEKINEEEYITKKSDNSNVDNKADYGKIKLNINKATQNELQELPGVGSVTAQKIIEYRNENGKFKNIEEIKNIKGIGESKFNNIKSYIYVK